MTDDRIQGTISPGFEPVRAAFVENFAKRGELGAACAVYVDGAPVVDLWGGTRSESTGAPWERDTIVPIFSTTKGLSALALSIAHSQALLDYDALVADYVPGFEQNGKSAITVRQLLAHQAGLAAVDTPATQDIWADLDALEDLLASQAPAWVPGERHGYHALTMGMCTAVLLHRVDPQHRTIGRFLAEELANPLDLNLYLGLPDEIPDDRVATLQTRKGLIAGLVAPLVRRHLPARFMGRLIGRPGSITARAFKNPQLDLLDLNSRELQRIEIPSANAMADARSIAKAYGEFATGGKTLGLRPATLHELQQPATPPRRGLHDEVLTVDYAYSIGFQKPQGSLDFGTTTAAFGHDGAGGSLGFADPATKTGFAYITNMLGSNLANDPREVALRRAAFACILDPKPSQQHQR